MSEKPNIAVAGASGFVGSNIRNLLAEHFNWRALTRSLSVVEHGADSDATEWVHCDLFSATEVENALCGCEQGIYLVHSMLPSSRMMQANFQDMDLLLADNFARAAKKAGLKQIIYLGGLLPEEKENLSPHLASRLEVEKILQRTGIPVMTLRAGLIFGPGGSSMRMLLNLVRRLPIMVLPQWTSCRTGSVDIRDIARSIHHLLDQPGGQSRHFDMATHKPMTYEEMILTAGEVLGKRPFVFHVPVNLIRYSRLWVQCFSGVPSTLVGPLMESLTYDLEAEPNELLDRVKPDAIPFEQSVKDSVDQAGRPKSNPRKNILSKDNRTLKEESRVRSIQRMSLPKGWDASNVAEAYRSWLPRYLKKILLAERENRGGLGFYLRFPRIKLLHLEHLDNPSESEELEIFSISSGLLVKSVNTPGRFEFRVIPETSCVVAAIHGYAPKIPWYIYEFTQAKIHLFVMQRFGKHLSHKCHTSLQ